MVVCDSFIYFELQKTGSSFIRSVLKENFKESYFTGKHDSIEDLSGDITDNLPDYLKIGSIRNPLSWYVSLWAFGCKEYGETYWSLTNLPSFESMAFLRSILFKRLLHIKADKKEWKYFYSDASNPQLFRDWLKKIHRETWLTYLTGSPEYSESQLGYMTSRYLRLYCPLENIKTLTYDIEGLIIHCRENSFIDFMIRQESLNSDLEFIIKRIKNNEANGGGMVKIPLKSMNTSKHLKIEDYYDLQSLKLVEIRDRLIIDLYNYGHHN